MAGPKSLLFTPLKLGATSLKHRVVMAPLTRFRADPTTYVPSDLAVQYYAQRASEGGLIISEATYVAEEAGGFPAAPGIWSEEQVAAWKKVTAAVHEKGGKIFLQLWALGRVASPKIVKTVWGPTSKPYSAGSVTIQGAPPTEVTAMTPADIDRFVEHYRRAALNAIDADFDGVEVHGANGYLLDEFLQSVSNDRTDEYGGSLENRFRFPLRVLNAVCEAVGPERVGIRMSPFNQFQGMREADPLGTFIPWTRTIVAAQPRLAYIHAVEARGAGVSTNDANAELASPADSLAPIREIVNAAGIKFMVCGGYNDVNAAAEADKTGDLIAFGRHFIANPDLPARLQNGWELNRYDRPTFYTGGSKGYVDYPLYQTVQVQA